MLQADSSIERALVTISGYVQGVGFRPFIYRLAQEHHLTGSVKNTQTGVKIDVQGTKEAIAKFQNDILFKKPNRALITEFEISPIPLGESSSFQIKPSESDAEKTLPLLPDSTMCKDCLQELFDPANRRYHYPFLHCISCGPRFSLFLRIPFDRANTTMNEFSMCNECQSEYENPENRRFFSQTNCCPACGPQLRLTDSYGIEIAKKDQAIHRAAELLHQGNIVALKNTGGYLLLVDAANEGAVQKLRRQKQRLSKPFAILMLNLAEAEAIAYLGEEEKQSLTSFASPIVLVRMKSDGTPRIAPSVSGESPFYGIMLAHNPIQHLLLHHFRRPLVATSGNISGRPLCISEQEAFEALSSIADFFLIHNRKINHRLDDSIVHVIAGQPLIMRKARGYTPSALSVPKSLIEEQDSDVFAAGSQMKNSFAFLKQDKIYMSQYIGDLDTADCCNAYDAQVHQWERLLEMNPLKSVCDKHPGYYSTAFVEKKKLPTHAIQHHQAHVWAGMIDCKLSPPFLSLSWDGTGWGDDGTVWGGEAFLVTDQSIHRIGSLYPFRLPGGEAAVREPRRSMLGIFHVLFENGIPPPYDAWLHRAFEQYEINILMTAMNKKLNAPLCSSIGRLFDAVSSILDLCAINDFEGHAAMLLEKAAYQAKNERIYPIPVIKETEMLLLDWRPMIRQILDDQIRGVKCKDLSLAFHRTLAQGIVNLAKMAGLQNILLTGGVMQNKLLVERSVALLDEAGFKPHLHRDVPPNDGGIAVGQLIGYKYKNRNETYVSRIAR